MLIGIISDTHGLLRPKVIEALRNADMVIHAGDIDNASVIYGLKELSPNLTAVL